MEKSQLRVKQIRFLSIFLNVTNKNDDLAIYYKSLMRSPITKALVTIEIAKATWNNLKDNVQVTRARLEIDN